MILVAGGTGRLGTLVTRGLVDRGLHVRVLTRALEHAAHLGNSVEFATGDVRHRSSVMAAANDVELVVSAVHGFIGPRGTSPRTVDRDGNRNLVDAAASVGAGFVMMSVVGAAPDSAMELFGMKHAAEQHLRSTGVPATVVRATAFMELWVDLLRQTAARSGRPLVFGRGDNPINFVSVRDVAALVVHVVTDAEARGETIEIGGPQDITFNELARAVVSADDCEVRPRHVPPTVLRLMASTVGRIKPQLGRQARAALAMDTEDLTFDAAPIHRRYPDLPTTRLADILSVHA